MATRSSPMSDTGIGIERGQVGKVFDMFAQLEPSSTRARNGLGIGLSIVKRLVEMHGGSISVHSEGRGHGTSFTFSLPLSTARQVHVVDAAATNGSSDRVRILVTDDNVESAVTLSMVLRKMGHEVRATHNATDALVEVPAFKPQVVFMDIGMPVMDGYEPAAYPRERERR